METNELKQLIGRECVVIDPRSKRKDYQTATIKAVTVSINNMARSNEIYEHISYNVELHKMTVTKRDRYGEIYEYHRSFNVSGERIVIR